MHDGIIGDGRNCRHTYTTQSVGWIVWAIAYLQLCESYARTYTIRSARRIVWDDDYAAISICGKAVRNASADEETKTILCRIPMAL